MTVWRSARPAAGGVPAGTVATPVAPTAPPPAEVPGATAAEVPAAPATQGRWRPAASYGAAAAAFLALSVGLWWDVWTSHPTAAATCGCGDPALFLWFLEWPAYALTHGKDLLHSAAVFHPTGLDLLSNTSVLAIGVPLVPVTLLFGPVATLNVAATLTPVLTGLAMFWLLRRWVRWTPAAFAGAVLYAFSPLAVVSLAQAHFMMAALAPFPLILGWLEDLVLRHRHRPVTAGAVLAALCGVEFFLSTELLAMLAIVTALGLAGLVAYGVATDRPAVARHARRAIPGLAVAAGGTAAVLAYPTWYALAGPAHLAGPVWPNLPQLGSLHLATLVTPQPRGGTGAALALGGYLGPVLPGGSYVGWGLVAVPALALAWWRRDRRLWFLAAMAAGTLVLAVGVRPGLWTPWRVLSRLPLGDSIIEQRFVAFTLLALCAMWALALDGARRLALPGRAGARPGAGRWTPAARLVAVGAAAAAVVVPVAIPLVGALPLAVRPVHRPAWVAAAGRTATSAHHAPGGVVFAYPAAFSGVETPMAWQALDQMAYTQAGGGGPEGVPARAGTAGPGMAVLTDLSFPLVPPPAGTPRQLAAVRRALGEWGVTTVVVPEQHDRPAMEEGRDPWYAAAFFAATFGRPPHIVHHAWVWSVRTRAPAVPTPSRRLAACATGAEARHAPGAVAPCVLRGGTPRAGGHG